MELDTRGKEYIDNIEHLKKNWDKKGESEMIKIGKTLPKKVRDKLDLVGYRVASIWGAEMISYTVRAKTRTIDFECIEHGEYFSTSISFDEIANYLNPEEI